MTFKAILIALALIPQVPSERDTPEKRAQQAAIASAIVEVSKGDGDLAAFLVAWGSHETNFSLRIQRGNCERWECDRGRARGPFQAHRNGMSDERWSRMIGVENTRFQVEQAAKHARWAMRECRLTGDARIVSAFRMLGARGCNQPLKGEGERLATYRKVRARL